MLGKRIVDKTGIISAGGDTDMGKGRETFER
jgi:hypothetical protein